MVGRHHKEEAIASRRQFGEGRGRDRRSGIARCRLEQNPVGLGVDRSELSRNRLSEGLPGDDQWRFEQFIGDAPDRRLQKRGAARQ